MITKKGLGWEILNSFYILFTLPFGFLSWLGFIIAGIRVRKLIYVIFGLLYLLPVIGIFYAIEVYPKEAENRPPAYDYFMYTFFIAWFVSVVHAFLIRKKFLLLLEARGIQSEQKGDRMRAEIHADMKVSENKIDETLVQYQDNDLSVRAVKTICTVFPFSPDFENYFNIEGAMKRVSMAATETHLQKAKELARGDDVVRAIKVSSAVDVADGGLGVFTGLKNAYDHAKKQAERTFEADPQQTADAALKGITIAYLIADLFEGSITEKVSAFLETKAGQEMLVYYASAEIALPFTDNLLESSGNLFQNMLSQAQQRSESRFADFAGSQALTEAKGILTELGTRMDGILVQVKQYTDPLLDRVSNTLPKIMNAADSATGAMATALDMLPVWKLLGSRLAAEAVCYRAMRS